MSKNPVNYITPLRGGVWRYGSGLSVYVEKLIDGRLIGASFRDNGIPVNTVDEDADTPSFGLTIDGQDMCYGWEFMDFSSEEAQDGTVTGTLTLRHNLKPVDVKVVTRCGGHGFFKRGISITNTSQTETLGLTAVSPLTGRIWPMADCLRENLSGA